MANGWLIFLGLLGAYMLGIVWLVRSGKMEKWKLSLLLGFILMIRTQRGQGLLRALARPRRLWNAFGDFGIVLTFVGMVGMTVLMLSLLPVVLRPDSGLEPLAASEILVIPGVNPFVPLWYGIIALIVTLVIHEGGHGVLALANKMRLKSVGLLFAIVPVGAFVEPDEDDLMASPRRNRLRVYAAGAAINVVAAAALLAAFAVMMTSLAPVAGVAIAAITVDAPSQDAGLEPGDILVDADGLPMPDWQAFVAFMDDQRPGDTVNLTTRSGDEHAVVLDSRWENVPPEEQEAILAEDPAALERCRLTLGLEETPTGGECAEGLQQDAFLGVSPFDARLVQDRLTHPVGSLENFLLYVSLPLGEVRGVPYLSTYLPAFYDTPFAEEVFWPTANVLFWVFWINLMVGLTNILPMLPLDGGHLFRDGVGGVLGRLKPKMDAERRDKIVGRLATGMSLVILGAFLLQIFGPRLL